MSACRKLSCLSSCKKSYLSFTSFLKYCKDITNLFIWYFGYAWSRPQQAIVATKKKLYAFLWMGFNYIKATESLRGGSLLHHLVGNSDIYPQTKNQLDPWTFSRDITISKMQSNLSRTFWSITQKQEFCQRWALWWKVKN